jgi:hypothetical protein
MRVTRRRFTLYDAESILEPFQASNPPRVDAG